MPTRTLDSTVCAICGNKLLVTTEEEGVIENTYKLSCDHVYPFNQYEIDVFYEFSVTFLDLFTQISRVLHPRLVHSRQEADVPLLQGKG